MRHSLLFFANQDAGNAISRYDLLARSAQFADSHGFEAVWIPERHFHPFGGAFPNPALAASVVAMRTTRVRIRAGSVVIPLHDVLRVAEDWSVIDNVSSGRVDISFASGWNSDDFVLAPERYKDRHDITLRMIKEFDDLWRGKSIRRINGENAEVDIYIYPRPVQPNPGYWLTCTASAERFIEAGSNGLNVLTALLFQTPAELKEKIAAYRAARAASAIPGDGQVTLMLHTYLGQSVEEVRQLVREPFTRYLASSTTLWKNRSKDLDIQDEQSKKRLLGFAFQRYFKSAALFGTVESCQPLVGQLADAGVDEIACLVDFGLDNDVVLGGLEEIARLAAAG
jgi:natural product biosynthesis luciferase-like monooxygenase protein